LKQRERNLADLLNGSSTMLNAFLRLRNRAGRAFEGADLRGSPRVPEPVRACASAVALGFA
jgi:hypothetical protein